MSLLKAWTLRGPPVAPAAEFRPLPSRLDLWLRRSQPRVPTIFRRDLSTDALAPADWAEVPLRRAALRPPRRWRAASLRRAAGPFGPAALVAAVLAGGTVLTDPAPDANASLAPVPGPATGGKAFEGGAVGVASLAAPLPPLPAPVSPGPETTASLAAPADPVAAGPRSDVGTAGSLVSAFAAVEGGPVRLARLEPDPTAGVPWRRPGPRGDVPGVAATKLLPFESAPFPYHGAMPGSGSAFLNTGRGERRGHRSRRGRILWEQETFSDNRVLVHVPKGFDADRPGVIVVFFHGHGATLRRDVLERQQVPAQISASGANAVLLAPQFAVDAPDSSAGRFWEQGGFARFLDEGAKQLARLSGDPAAAAKFASMPVVIVAYSGGFAPAAYALQAGGARNRVRGVVLLDAMYGEYEKFANWIATTRSTFFVNASSHFTQGRAAALKRMLADRDVPAGTELKGSLSRGGVAFLATGSEVRHRDYVNQAWTAAPIRDILARLPEYRLRDAEPVLSAEARPARRERSAAAQ